MILRVVLVWFALISVCEGEVEGELNWINERADSTSNRFLATSKDDDCKVLQECSLCDAVARSTIAECKKTGRVERWQCEVVVEGEEEEDEGATPPVAGAGTSNIYRSCNRTTADDEFLMVRLQVVCVLIGTAAFVSARKQKVLSASLFDQRKMGQDARQEAKRRRRDSSIITTTPQEIEMAQLEETIPLTDEVDVV